MRNADQISLRQIDILTDQISQALMDMQRDFAKAHEVEEGLCAVLSVKSFLAQIVALEVEGLLNPSDIDLLLSRFRQAMV